MGCGWCGMPLYADTREKLLSWRGGIMFSGLVCPITSGMNPFSRIPVKVNVKHYKNSFTKVPRYSIVLNRHWNFSGYIRNILLTLWASLTAVFAKRTRNSIGMWAHKSLSYLFGLSGPDTLPFWLQTYSAKICPCSVPTWKRIIVNINMAGTLPLYIHRPFKTRTANPVLIVLSAS